jgi:hypothetical protein
VESLLPEDGTKYINLLDNYASANTMKKMWFLDNLSKYFRKFEKSKSPPVATRGHKSVSPDNGICPRPQNPASSSKVTC